MPYTDLMNKTKMTHDELIASVMAEYTARVAAEEAYRQAVRRGEIAPLRSNPPTGTSATATERRCP